MATRPDTSGRRTYGSDRAEVFASGLAVLLMLGVAAYVVLEAVARAGPSPTCRRRPCWWSAASVSPSTSRRIALLRAGSRESLNVRGAYLEVVADAAGSVGVIAAGVLVGITGDAVWDTAVAVAIGAFVAVRVVPLGRQVLAVLGSTRPPG